MANPPFIGRREELERLATVHNAGSTNLAVVKGRRRIGKSRLILELSKRYPKNTFWSFAGLAPQDGVSAQAQRDHFARQLAATARVPPLTFHDWSDAFQHLSLYLKGGDIVLFDEISWMGSKDPTFIPKLKAWWDTQRKHLLLVFCGSVSTWIEENIIKSTAFFGRINLTITLGPLSLPESGEFLRRIGLKTSDYDTFKILSVVGGVPWYLEQFHARETADENIKRLAFSKDGLLVSEFEHIFADLFNGKGETHKKIIVSLRDGAKTLSEVREAIAFPHSGTLSELMEHLITAGFVCKHPLWSFKTAKPLKQSLYALSDPYMRFYLKMIEPNLGRIAKNGFKEVSLHALPGFEPHLGLQLEHLITQNRALLLNAIGIRESDVIADGPYRQSETKAHRGCQVDYLVQTTTKNIFVCELKFKRREVTADVLDEMKEKLARLKIPRGFAALPVLLHLSGVSDTVTTSPFFYRLVEITDFLRE